MNKSRCFQHSFSDFYVTSAAGVWKMVYTTTFLLCIFMENLEMKWKELKQIWLSQPGTWTPDFEKKLLNSDKSTSHLLCTIYFFNWYKNYSLWYRCQIDGEDFFFKIFLHSHISIWNLNVKKKNLPFLTRSST